MALWVAGVRSLSFNNIFGKRRLLVRELSQTQTQTTIAAMTTFIQATPPRPASSAY